MLQDPPVRNDQGDSARPTIPRATSPTSTWRFASRLARREVRRRPGRTLLVMALVMIPVFAMTLGIVAARTGSQTLDAKWQDSYGDADAFVRRQIPMNLGADYAADYEPLELPAGSTTIDYTSVFTNITGLDGDGEEVSPYVQYTDYPVDADITGDSVTVVDGRLPTEPGEVALTRSVADRFDTDVDRTLSLTQPDVEWDVVGIIEKASNLREDWVLVDDVDPAMILEDQLQTFSLVDYPEGFTLAEETALVDFTEANRFGDRGFITDDLESRRDWRGAQAGVDPVVVLGGWIAGVIGFIAVGIVIAAAFAASARRQLVTIGQLSANGAPARLIRRTLALQGSWSGLIGATVGVVAAIVTARFGLSTIETIISRRADGLVVRPLDIGVIVLTAVVAASIAALIPSKSSSRLPVLAALAGRRPVASPPRWMAPTGLALFGGGLALLAGAAGSGNGNAFAVVMAVIGGLAVLFGMVCCSPFAVSVIGWASHRLRGSMRLAARSLSRTRGRSAAVVTAIATVMALSTAGLTVAQSVAQQRTENRQDGSTLVFNWYRDVYEQPDDSVNEPDGDEPPLRTDVPFEELITPDPIPADQRTAMENLLPDAEWIPVRTVAATTNRGGGSVTIADPAILERFALPDAQRDLLAVTGAVAITPFTPNSITVLTAEGEISVDVGPPLPQQDWDDGMIEPVFGIWTDIVMTEERADAEGLPVRTTQFLVDNPSDLDDETIEVVDRLQREQFGIRSAFVEPGEPRVIDVGEVNRAGQWSIERPYLDNPFPATLVLSGALGVTLLMVLAVVAIGLSLAATEGRDERSVLHAIGAAPRTLRRLAASKGWMLATAAAIIAVPTGYLVMAVVFRVNDAPFPFPWVGAVTLLLGVPLVAAASTLAVSALGQRFRPAPAMIAHD